MERSPILPEKPVATSLQPSLEELMTAYNDLPKQKALAEALIEENTFLK